MKILDGVRLYLLTLWIIGHDVVCTGVYKILVDLRFAGNRLRKNGSPQMYVCVSVCGPILTKLKGAILHLKRRSWKGEGHLGV